jgi:hypothetical protein
MLTLLPLIATAATLAALLRSSDIRLKIYIAGVLGGTFVLAVVLWAYEGDVEAGAYKFAYFACAIFQVLSMLNVGRPRIVGGIIALTIGLSVLTAMPQVLNSYIALTEGVCFILAAISLAAGMALDMERYQLNIIPYRVLAFLWLFLGLFDIGYCMRWKLLVWHGLNLWGKYALGIWAFTAIALFWISPRRQPSARRLRYWRESIENALGRGASAEDLQASVRPIRVQEIRQSRPFAANADHSTR